MCVHLCMCVCARACTRVHVCMRGSMYVSDGWHLAVLMVCSLKAPGETGVSGESGGETGVSGESGLRRAKNMKFNSTKIEVMWCTRG